MSRIETPDVVKYQIVNERLMPEVCVDYLVYWFIPGQDPTLESALIMMGMWFN